MKESRCRGGGGDSAVAARRNARERRRVQAVNAAFSRLRRLLLPSDHNRGKRVSKVKTLQRAIEYISTLLSLLQVCSVDTYGQQIDLQLRPLQAKGLRMPKPPIPDELYYTFTCAYQ